MSFDNETMQLALNLKEKYRIELQELRQRLAGIERVKKTDVSFTEYTFCPACGADKWKFNYETEKWESADHEPDCWLASEIEKGKV